MRTCGTDRSYAERASSVPNAKRDVGSLTCGIGGRLKRLWPEGAGVSDSANVPRASRSSFIWQDPKSTLRHSPQHPRQWRWLFARTEQPPRIRLMGCLAQRHKGGGRRPGDSRGAEYPVGLILPPSSQLLTLTRPPTYTPLTCRHFGTDRMSKALQKPRRQHGC